MVKLARPLIRRLGLEADVGADDVANAALQEICERAGSGKLPRFESSDGFWSYVRSMMTQFSLRTRRDRRSLKRGGPGRNASGDRAGQGPDALRQVDLDAVDLPCTGATTEETVLGREEVERFMELLRCRGLEETVRMLQEGFAIEQIAEVRGWSVWTVKRRLRRARELWIKWERRC